MVVVASEDEEEVGEAVDIGYYKWTDVFLVGEGEDSAFGTAAYGAAYVCVGRFGRSAGQDELVDFGHTAVEGVDCALYFFLVGGGESEWLGLGVGGSGSCGEVAAYVEEGVLNFEQQCCDLFWGYGECGQEAQVCRKFVDGAVGFYSATIFLYALTANE